MCCYNISVTYLCLICVRLVCVLFLHVCLFLTTPGHHGYKPHAGGRRNRCNFNTGDLDLGCFLALFVPWYIYIYRDFPRTCTSFGQAVNSQLIASLQGCVICWITAACVIIIMLGIVISKKQGICDPRSIHNMLHDILWSKVKSYSKNNVTALCI